VKIKWSEKPTFEEVEKKVEELARWFSEETGAQWEQYTYAGGDYDEFVGGIEISNFMIECPNIKDKPNEWCCLFNLDSEGDFQTDESFGAEPFKQFEKVLNFLQDNNEPEEDLAVKKQLREIFPRMNF
jgi:hypothetical protein